jgi:mevalonate kinase
MVHENYKSYPAKILLFGEYVVLQGGNALAIPHPRFAMQKSKKPEPNNKEFYTKFHEFISSKSIFRDRIHPAFKNEIGKGLNFDSNIPVGYGLGSSGALVAAIYDNYIEDPAIDFKELQSELAMMECFFHEKSSGIDPLTSFLQVPILSSNNEIFIMEDMQPISFKLIDSGQKRNAREAIKHFNHLCLDVLFKSKLEELKTLSNLIIDQILIQEKYQDELMQYSQFQFDLFTDFIPEKIKLEWKKGLENKTYAMKLCGAGMGGMYLKFPI